KPLTLEQARYIAGHTNTTGYDTYSALTQGTINAEQAAARVLEQVAAYLPRCERWISHYENRLKYERAMLAEDGGTVADKTGPEVGGACRCWASPGYGRGWSYIKKVNKVSVTVEDNWGN